MDRILLVTFLVVAMKPSVLGNRATTLCGDETGYNCMFQSNERELADFAVQFDKDLPPWLSGTLIRNGVGLFEKGKRSMTHVFDGFAKLSSWKIFSNGTAFFSTRFIRSEFYQKSVKENNIAPYMLYSPPTPKFNVVEKAKCFKNKIDNMNVNVLHFPGKTGTNFLTFTDFWSAYQISAKDLSTVKLIQPKLKNVDMLYLNMLSSAHPLPEPGTNNRLTFLVRQKKLFFTKNRLALIRMTSVSKRSVIAEWKIKGSVPYMHSFSVTQNKAVMLAGPYITDNKCIFKTASPLPCTKWFKKKSSTLYIADLKTGKKITIRMPAIFVLHHINAYELNKNEIIMDVASYDSPALVSKLLMLDYIRSSTERSNVYTPPRNKRIHINIKKKTAKIIDMSTTNVITDGLDMPAINELHRSKHYCYVYGPNNFADGESFIASAIIKKNMCDGGRVMGTLQIPFHYPVEPAFVPNPDGETEDDGVLLVPFLRGKEAVTYLAVVDAKTMTIISKADMPDYIPFSLHGRFLKDYF